MRSQGWLLTLERALILLVLSYLALSGSISVWNVTWLYVLGPAGASLVELILDGAPKTVDITPFRFERFAEGKLLEGEHGYGHIWK